MYCSFNPYMSKNIASVTLCSMIKHKWYLSFRTFDSWKQLMYIRIELISILHVILFSYFYVTCELDSSCSFNQEAIKLLTQLVTATGWKTIFKHLHRMKFHLFHEWWLNGHWMVTGKVDFSRISDPFSYHSVDWMAGTFQWPFSQLIFLKLNCAWRGSNPGCKDQKDSTLIITPR